MEEQRLEELFRRYLQGTLTDAEETELFQLWLDPSLADSRVQILSDFYDRLPEDKDMPARKADLVFQQIMKGQNAYRSSHKTAWISWRRIAVAASVLIVIGLSGYLLFNKKMQPRQEVVQAPVSAGKESPGMNRAMILLANKQKIFLDSASNGSLAMQGTVSLLKLQDGKIAYEATAGASGEQSYNTLVNPRGSKIIDMQLTDGSHVWLNAGSSVTFPVAFTGKERKISVEGEAYFEVAEDASKPFLVTRGKTTVKVLGTHFNVNAYDDETDMRITLLQGSVQVINDQSAAMIKPGEQAIVKADKINIAAGVDLNQVMSWKEGYFRMKGTDLASLMRQIARWYDVEVIYEKEIPRVRFGGLINRDASLPDVLKALEQYGIYSRLDKGRIMVQ